MAVPSDRNTSVKVVEKLSKYKDLETEIERMWKMETETIPVVIGALKVIEGTGKIRKIPKIIPGTYIFQRPFLRGLFLEGLIFGEAYLWRENCVSKSIGLAF